MQIRVRTYRSQTKGPNSPHVTLCKWSRTNRKAAMVHRSKSRRTVPLLAVAATPGAPGVSPLAQGPHDEAFAQFARLAQTNNMVPMYQRLMADQLTPVLAYRCLVREDDREAPSFLFESVVNGTQQGRYSFVGAQPTLEILATGPSVNILYHNAGSAITHDNVEDPLQMVVDLSSSWKAATSPGLPPVFTGGWVGYVGYDTVRYVFPGKLPFSGAPVDDRSLPDMHLALYKNVVVFDHATKLVYVVTWVDMTDFNGDVKAAYASGSAAIRTTTERIAADRAPQLLSGIVSLDLGKRPQLPSVSNMTKEEFLAAVAATKEYVQSGDVFQLVLSQRFERKTFADPFEIYRSLRVVNPSPYMAYLQARGCIVVASSPEILCRVGEDGKVTNRPLAGTRARGRDEIEDEALEKELLADEKEKAEHVMLVDLGRNDVGRVARAGSVKVEKLMEIERYSHVMHISSTVTGQLMDGLSSWDALRAALPAGTVSGAPKVRAMQIIDELEASKRGPYGGGIGHVSFTGGMDMALALRTMVVPTAMSDALYSYDDGGKSRREWRVHLQAGAGLVADSVPESEYEETVNKSAALGRAIDLAEQAFVGSNASSLPFSCS